MHRTQIKNQCHKPWLRVSRFIALVMAVFACTVQAQWRHNNSPFRAEFQVVENPNHPRGGLRVNVPVCGLSRNDGLDLYAYDQKGQQLAVRILGPSRKNTVAAIIESRPIGEDVTIYFGSGGRAPQNRTGFRPSPILTLRSFDGEHELQSWEDVEPILDRAPPFARLFSDNIRLTHNPYDSRDKFIMDFRGYLKIPQTGDYTYMLVSDDAGYLFIDDEMLIASNGRHYVKDSRRGEFRGNVRLSAGLHPVRCVVFEAGGRQAAIVAQWKDGRQKWALKPEQFAQSGTAKLTNVAARRGGVDGDIPAFDYEHKCYINFEGVNFTWTQLRTYNKRAARWKIADGIRAKGAKLGHIFTGLDSREIKVRQGRIVATGRVDFPEKAPSRWRLHNPQHFARFSKQIMAEPLEDLDTKTLVHYRHLLKYREYNPNVLPLCEILLQRANVEQDTRKQLLYDIARIGAGSDTRKAAQAYSSLLAFLRGQSDSEAYRELLQEAYGFALQQAGDVETATKLLEEIGGNSDRHPNKNPQFLRLRAELALHKGNIETARKLIDKLMVVSEVGRTQKVAAVRSNALQGRFYQLLKDGFLDKARHTLRKWVTIAPGDWISGRWSLARAKLFEAMGWKRAAITTLQNTLKINSLPPNLPEIEYTLARLYENSGEREQAVKLYTKIRDDYQNHSVADQAASRLKKLQR